VRAYDTYVLERDRCRPARDCDFVLVNLLHPALRAPMRAGVINELLTMHVSLAVSAHKDLAE
jgi:integrase/recombinase XerD